ncbi:AMP-binding protein [Parafrigoribacterium mesophilum]|uniref:AMP-binding protein n=1 Tax=Parafrigoribacterium mesophilum TaxID=433646 RepID=UPI0031FCF173
MTGTATLSYAGLAERVAERRAQLGTTRRLVMVQAPIAIEPIVTYLAALAGGHPVMLVEPGTEGSPADRHRRRLIERFDPDVVALGEADGWGLDVRRPGTRHALHPDLAMLGSTSGSTGSPKLVRLSAENLHSNASAIADYLGLTPADRAATTLPLHYCYGLSVLNSHLLAEASVLLTDRSVTEQQFWDDFVAFEATSFAGVPHTFDLLDATGFAERSLPTLRYITQAGGRLGADRIREYARLGRERGFDFVVMYGQTEATARMAYLPPRRAESSAGAIGIAIPGSTLRLDAAPGETVGELVFRGPGVMLGYAEAAADFAAGRTVGELRTGDLARIRKDGLFEIVGRLKRFVKVFGLRVDLDQVETLLSTGGPRVRAVGVDDRLVLFVTTARHEVPVRTQAAKVLGLPQHAIHVHAISEFPLTSSGKPDNAALRAYAATRRPDQTTDTEPAKTTADVILGIYRELLGRPGATLADSFAGLDGDSLSFVEVALRLEELGEIPRDWPTMTVRALADFLSPERATQQAVSAQISATSGTASGRPARRRMPRIEVPAILRAVAILLIVGTHADLFRLQGGAHLLMVIVGYNLARFQFAAVPGRSRVRPLLRSSAHVAVPAVVWIGTAGLLTGFYQPATALLLNGVVGQSAHWSVQWQFWFLEAIIWTMLGLAVLFAVPAIDRMERARPYAFALGLVGVALAARLVSVQGVQAGPVERYMIVAQLWCIALGWLIARSNTARARIVATVVALAAIAGFFGDPLREGVVLGGTLLLIWIPALPIPRLVIPLIGALAGASMFVYLTHWQVYPPFEDTAPWLGTLLSLAVGIATWRLYNVATTGARSLIRRKRSQLMGR